MKLNKITETSDYDEYSDHNILKLDTGLLKITQLNVAQLGRLQLFPNDKLPEKFIWSCTLRTVTILKLLIKVKHELIQLGFRLLAIVNNLNLSLVDKNINIEKESHIIFNELVNLGFSVKSFKMVPNKLFNPNVLPNILYQNPNDYLKGPSFVLEDTNSFTHRMEKGFNIMFENNPDIITAQEVEFGDSDGINFTNVHNSLLKLHESYICVVPVVQLSGTLCSTYYNKNVFDDISVNCTNMITELKTRMKCFGDSEWKTIVTTLKHKNTKKPFTIINIHADYSKSNNEGPWKILRDIVENTPNIIVCGDFNLTLNNKAYFENAFSTFKGHYIILQTPEPTEIGNPTYDLILSN